MALALWRSAGKVAITRTAGHPSASRQVGQPCSRTGRNQEAAHDPGADHQCCQFLLSEPGGDRTESTPADGADYGGHAVEMPRPGSGAEESPARTPADDPGDSASPPGKEIFKREVPTERGTSHLLLRIGLEDRGGKALKILAGPKLGVVSPNTLTRTPG